MSTLAAPTTATPISAHNILMRAGGTAVFLHCGTHSVPEVLYWGRDIGPLSHESLATWEYTRPGIGGGTADVAPRLSLVPTQAEGWLGTPGLEGSRAGFGQFSAFIPTAIAILANDGTEGAPSHVRVTTHDDEADLDLIIDIELSPSGLLRTKAALVNQGEDGYAVGSLMMALPVPANETFVIDQSGHHLRERDTSTHEFSIGVHERNNRIARGHAMSSIHGTCEPETGWHHGEVHYIHVAWSGNTRTIAERNVVGQNALLGGELLLPGEVTLGHGESYETPWIVATWGDGLDQAAARIHAFLRARPHHPRTARPVTLNVWEAVYFDHSLDRQLALGDAAAEVGAERFVLDDGWFGSRRDDSSGLGDWVVSPEVWPGGLAPLADAVHAKGMQFGLWFEPEMINPDSEAARAHPEWILSPASHRPQEARMQQVIDLTNPAAFAHVLGQMRTVLTDTQIDYIKWDFNRDLYEAISPLTGKPAYHAQTLATYRLMDTLLAEFPSLEIESCAGGGGRIDLGIMERAVRVWGSDCIDPLERQGIEEGTSLLLPPEMVGSHVASTTSHTTGRTLNLTVRASTAMFSHMGIEWNLLDASPQERADLAAWIRLHKELRTLLHSGTVTHVDHHDEGWSIHGVISDDRSEAVFSLMRMATSPVRPIHAVQLPGLDPDATYHVSELLPAGIESPVTRSTQFPHSWAWWFDGVTLPGSVLSVAGLRYPDLNPERAILIELTRV